MSNNEVRFLVTLGIDPKELKIQADKALKEYKNHTIKFDADTKALEEKLDSIFNKYTNASTPMKIAFDADISRAQKQINKLKDTSVVVDVTARTGGIIVPGGSGSDDANKASLIERQNRLLQQQAKLENDLARLRNTNPRFARQNDSMIQQLKSQLDSLKNNPIYGANSQEIMLFNRADFAQAQRSLNDTRIQLDQLRQGSSEAARNSLNLIDNLRIAMQRFPIWMISSTIFYQTANGIQDLTEKTIELDTAMTNLMRVMDLPNHQFNEMLLQSISNVDRLSGTMTGYLEILNEFGRMGFNGDESLALSNTTQMLANISDLDASEAVSALTGALISFNMAAEDSYKIADKLNEVDNNFSITTKDLTRSIGRAASTANTFGVSLEELIGYTTA